VVGVYSVLDEATASTVDCPEGGDSMFFLNGKCVCVWKLHSVVS